MMSDHAERPRAPRGLGAEGRRFWRSLVADYEFTAGELVLLEKAARTLDDVARIEGELAGAPLTVAGSTGQVRPHPLLAELRGMRALFASLLRSLALDHGEDETPRGRPLTNSERGRMAARARWGGRR